MKNISLTFLFIICLTCLKAQITLQYSFPSTKIYSLSVVKFGYGGDKYVLLNLEEQQIEIYSMNQVLEQTINIPDTVYSNYYQVYYISDNLFDLDSSIEYLVNKPVNLPNIANTYIVNADESILLEIDSAAIGNYTNPYLFSEFNNIYPTTDGTKLILRKSNNSRDVYSLPGSLPCYECSNGVYNGNIAGGNSGERQSSLSNPYPNPTNDLTRINYQLPDGVTQGELVFYNTTGIEIKRFKVTSTFSFINVSAKDLPAGTYYYTLQTSAGKSDRKKMVVIR